jgi:hypothetical protein
MRAEQYNPRPPAVFKRSAIAQQAVKPDTDFTLPAAFLAIAVAITVGACTLML